MHNPVATIPKSRGFQILKILVTSMRTKFDPRWGEVMDDLHLSHLVWKPTHFMFHDHLLLQSLLEIWHSKQYMHNTAFLNSKISWIASPKKFRKQMVHLYFIWWFVVSWPWLWTYHWLPIKFYEAVLLLRSNLILYTLGVIACFTMFPSMWHWVSYHR